MKPLLLIAVLLAAGGSVPAGAQGLPAPSTWKNQAGSILTIAAVDAQGHFTGSYDNEAPGYPCHDVFDLKGATAGNQISFAVVWKNARMSCGSVTAWQGTINGTTITTSWELAYGNPATGKLEIKRGSSRFEKQ